MKSNSFTYDRDFPTRLRQIVGSFKVEFVSSFSKTSLRKWSCQATGKSRSRLQLNAFDWCPKISLRKMGLLSNLPMVTMTRRILVGNCLETGFLWSSVSLGDQAGIKMNITIHKQILDLLEDAGMVGMTLNVSREHRSMTSTLRLLRFDHRNSLRLSVDSTNELLSSF